MGVNNRAVDAHMSALFGPERLRALQDELDGARPAERERVLRRGLGDALTDAGAQYLIPFRFARTSGRASHSICFVSKHPLGYEIMKDIMASHSVVDADGVPKFEYLPEVKGRQLAFEIDRPISALGPDLLNSFAGKTLAMIDIYHAHNVGTPFIQKNYKSVLRQLEEADQAARCRPVNNDAGRVP